MVRITDRGRSVHKEKPENLNVTYLKQYPEFVEFHTYKGPKKKSPSDGDSEVPDSPEVALEQAYEHIKGGVTRDLLDQVKDGTPSWFEGLVVKLLRKMGYGGPGPDAAQVVGGSGDGGVDGIIKQDQLGLDIVYIQAKRWENPVGRPEVQKFAGSLDGFSANKGVMITTSTFSKGAHEYANSINKNIVLIEGEKLSELMFEHNIGVTTEIAYEVKKIDTDFFFDD
jgi:restriction system protein